MQHLTELERATVRSMREKLQDWIDLATTTEKRDAVCWYRKGHEYAEDIGKTYGCTIDQACAVISVLSPSTAWDTNIQDAYAVCEAWRTGTYDATVGTYGRQLAKAYVILEDCKGMKGDDLLPYVGTEGARKTRAFYKNLLHPATSQEVTIDRWILRALGLPVNRTTPQLYRLGEMAVCQMAQHYKCQPHKVQALVWVCIRNRGGAPQTAFNLPGF